MRKIELVELCDETMNELNEYELDYIAMIAYKKQAIMCHKGKLSKKMMLETLAIINVIKQLKSLNLLKKKKDFTPIVGEFITQYDLVPIHGKQSSFYGKAKVFIDENNNRVLYSYNTPIILKKNDGTLVRLWDGYSYTTGKHIKSFCGLNKEQFLDLEVKKLNHIQR